MSARSRNFPLTEPTSPVENGRDSSLVYDAEPIVKPVLLKRSSEEKTSILSRQAQLKPE